VSFYVQFLGTGSALPKNHAHPTSQYLFCQNRHFLIDCGEGTQIQLRLRRIKIQKLDCIFISHLHGDHYFGLVGLLSSMHLLGRKKAISIYAPAALEGIVRSQLELGNARLDFDINFHVIEDMFEGEVFADQVISVTTFRLKHKIPTHGFIFKEKVKMRPLLGEKFKNSGLSIRCIDDLKSGNDVIDDKGQTHSYLDYTREPKSPGSYAFCSDTAYSERVISFIENCSVLYHEATFIAKEKARAKSTLHSTAEQAAKIADMAKVKSLYIGHLSARYENGRQHLAEAKPVFENTFLAEEGMIVKITH
jgi:ribonuclease Z